MTRTCFLAAILAIFALPMDLAQASQLSVGDAMSELQYNLTVQWDQKDQLAKANFLKTFSTEIDSIRESGVTDEQLLQSIANESGNPQSAKDLNILADYAKTNQLTSDQIANVVNQYASQNGHEGANWMGCGGGCGQSVSHGAVIGLAVVAVAVIAIIVVHHYHHANGAVDDTTTTDNTTCTTGDSSNGGNSGDWGGNGGSWSTAGAF
jgi:bacterioferritin-associated ferredoxin